MFGAWFLGGIFTIKVIPGFWWLGTFLGVGAVILVADR